MEGKPKNELKLPDDARFAFKEPREIIINGNKTNMTKELLMYQGSDNEQVPLRGEFARNENIVKYGYEVKYVDYGQDGGSVKISIKIPENTTSHEFFKTAYEFAQAVPKFDNDKKSLIVKITYYPCYGERKSQTSLNRQVGNENETFTWEEFKQMPKPGDYVYVSVYSIERFNNPTKKGSAGRGLSMTGSMLTIPSSLGFDELHLNDLEQLEIQHDLNPTPNPNNPNLSTGVVQLKSGDTTYIPNVQCIQLHKNTDGHTIVDEDYVLLVLCGAKEVAPVLACRKKRECC